MNRNTCTSLYEDREYSPVIFKAKPTPGRKTKVHPKYDHRAWCLDLPFGETIYARTRRDCILKARERWRWYRRFRRWQANPAAGDPPREYMQYG